MPSEGRRAVWGCVAWQGQPVRGLHLACLAELRERDARVCEVSALCCRDASCLHNVLLLFDMDAGNSTRLLLRGETCLEMENMVYYSCFLQQCLAGLLDAGLNSERRCTDTMVESL